MKKNLEKVFALVMAIALLCTGCGLSGAPAESTDTTPGLTSKSSACPSLWAPVTMAPPPPA